VNDEEPEYEMERIAPYQVANKAGDGEGVYSMLKNRRANAKIKNL